MSQDTSRQGSDDPLIHALCQGRSARVLSNRDAARFGDRGTYSPPVAESCCSVTGPKRPASLSVTGAWDHLPSVPVTTCRTGGYLNSRERPLRSCSDSMRGARSVNALLRALRVVLFGEGAVR